MDKITIEDIFAIIRVKKEKNTMKNRIKRRDIANVLTIVYMESGAIFTLDPYEEEYTINHIFNMIFDSIINQNDTVKNVTVKVILNNGGWAETDGKFITSQNVKDKKFLKNLKKTIYDLYSIYVRCMNYTNKSTRDMTIAWCKFKMYLALAEFTTLYVR